MTFFEAIFVTKLSLSIPTLVGDPIPIIAYDLIVVKAKVLKLADIQAELGVSRWTLYEWLRNGKLKGFKLPCGHYRVPADELPRIRSKSGEAEGDG